MYEYLKIFILAYKTSHFHFGILKYILHPNPILHHFQKNFQRKSFCNILGAEWHLLPLEKTKIINSSLYEQKNHFSYPVSVADDANFSCHCAAESRHDLHLPLRTAEGHVLRALEWQ